MRIPKTTGGDRPINFEPPVPEVGKNPGKKRVAAAFFQSWGVMFQKLYDRITPHVTNFSKIQNLNIIWVYPPPSNSGK